MATTSTIALEQADSTVISVYCHYDGGISYNGRILQAHYDTPAKVQALLAFGNISQLGHVIGEKHPFCSFEKTLTADQLALYDTAQQEKWCKFYGRDRGEQGQQAEQYSSFAEYTQDAEDYNYIMRNGEWYVSHADLQDFEPLEVAEAC